MIGFLVGAVVSLLVQCLYTNKFLYEEENPAKFAVLTLGISLPIVFLITYLIEIGV